MTATNKTSQLGKPTGHEIRRRNSYKITFFDADSLEWTPGLCRIPGSSCLGSNTVTGGFSMIQKVAPNNVAPFMVISALWKVSFWRVDSPTMMTGVTPATT